MNKNFLKVLGFAVLTALTVVSCKKETTTPTNSTSSKTSDTTKIITDTIINTMGSSGFNIKVNTTNYEFIGDNTGVSKDSVMGAMIFKDKNTGKYHFAFMYQKKEATSDTSMFIFTAAVSSFSNTNFTTTSKDTLMVMTALSGKSGFMYFQEDVKLTFTNSSPSPAKGSIISGSIDGKISGIDYSTFKQVTHPISGTFKAVYQGETDNFTTKNPPLMNKEYKAVTLEKFNLLLKSQND